MDLSQKYLKPSNQKQLLDLLNLEQPSFSKIVVDSSAFIDHPLSQIAKKFTPNSIDVFYRQFDIGMEVYVCDECGSLYHSLFRGKRDQNFLRVLHGFLRSVVQRSILSQKDFEENFGIYPIHFYEILEARDNTFNVKQKNITRAIPTPLFSVKAIAHVTDAGNIIFDFYCNDQEFSAASFGEQLEMVVAQFILSQREGPKYYPIYLTDLDLTLARAHISKNHNLQISHYLHFKERIEFRLNQTIGILLNA